MTNEQLSQYNALRAMYEKFRNMAKKEMYKDQESFEFWIAKAEETKQKMAQVIGA